MTPYIETNADLPHPVKDDLQRWLCQSWVCAIKDDFPHRKELVSPPVGAAVTLNKKHPMGHCQACNIVRRNGGTRLDQLVESQTCQ